jgi:hypothetical protein
VFAGVAPKVLFATRDSDVGVFDHGVDGKRPAGDLLTGYAEALDLWTVEISGFAGTALFKKGVVPIAQVVHQIRIATFRTSSGLWLAFLSRMIGM